jgi:hypothetical protein
MLFYSVTINTIGSKINEVKMGCRMAGREKQVAVHNFTESNSKTKIIKN